ncbi:hypothetical protein QWJ90_12640 [Microbacterium oryzae]|uniref:hypothetical protein n=1 Tax=Microbacterium oryzae TaxID=743009 RepID=UPI0025B26707|nr:hypothetical protein [Microbacterium oryzae]MDN3311777.1 hypothetical protein [Microbacterium oryzae]
MRELPDLRVLAGITTVEEAEELFGQFYPGDEFSERTAQVVEQAVLGAGPPADPVTFPDLDR